MNQPLSQAAPDRDYRVRLTTEEFLAIGDMPPFDLMTLELVHGEMERMPPSLLPHARMQSRLNYLLTAALNDRPDLLVVCELGVDLGQDTIFGCDIAIVRPIDEKRMARPADLLLVVEVSSTTQARDLGMKRREYGRAGVPDYWVVDVEAGMVHRFTAPAEGEYEALEPVAFGAALPVPGTGQTIVVG